MQRLSQLRSLPLMAADGPSIWPRLLLFPLIHDSSTPAGLPWSMHNIKLHWPPACLPFSGIVSQPLPHMSASLCHSISSNGQTPAPLLSTSYSLSQLPCILTALYLTSSSFMFPSAHPLVCSSQPGRQTAPPCQQMSASAAIGLSPQAPHDPNLSHHVLRSQNCLLMPFSLPLCPDCRLSATGQFQSHVSLQIVCEQTVHPSRSVSLPVRRCHKIARSMDSSGTAHMSCTGNPQLGRKEKVV